MVVKLGVMLFVVVVVVVAAANGLYLLGCGCCVKSMLLLFGVGCVTCAWKLFKLWLFMFGVEMLSWGVTMGLV